MSIYFQDTATAKAPFTASNLSSSPAHPLESAQYQLPTVVYISSMPVFVTILSRISNTRNPPIKQPRHAPYRKVDPPSSSTNTIVDFQEFYVRNHQLVQSSSRTSLMIYRPPASSSITFPKWMKIDATMDGCDLELSFNGLSSLR